MTTGANNPRADRPNADNADLFLNRGLTQRGALSLCHCQLFEFSGGRTSLWFRLTRGNADPDTPVEHDVGLREALETHATPGLPPEK